MNYQQELQDFVQEPNWFESDLWDTYRLKPGTAGEVNPVRWLDFAKIVQPWLREAAKKYLKFRLTSFSAKQLQVDLNALIYFSESLKSSGLSRKATDLCRDDIANFIHLLAQKYSVSSRIMYLSAVKNFLERASAEGWSHIPEKTYFMRGDFPRASKALPRFIPEDVLSQLEAKKDQMPKKLYRQVTILLGTGMRISELCGLPYDCLIQDNAGDYFIRYNQFKMKKEHTVPILVEVFQAISQQRDEVLIKYKKGGRSDKPKYLFPNKKDLNRPSNTGTFRIAINKFANEAKIVDSNNSIFHFEPHQFRHTYGTRLINNGARQYTVQKLLGHETEMMTSRYAVIQDHQLKKEYLEAHGKLVNFQGKLVENLTDNPSDLQWLKSNILAQSLPNGYCGLPLIKSGCTHANACLTCTHFRTDKSFLSVHKEQIKETKKLIDTAKKNGWKRVEEVNQTNLNNLGEIVGTLEEMK